MIKLPQIICIIAFVLTAGCYNTDSNDIQIQADTGDLSDNEIMAKVYLNHRTPDGFYQEELPDIDYTIRHLLNTDLLSLVVVDLGMPVYEISTDDFTEALDWSETVALQQAVYEQLVDTTETDLYFQFTRFKPSPPEQTHYSRVFKNSSFDRNDYDRNNNDSYLGTITFQNPTIEQVKYIIEYLWTFTFNNNYGTAVLESNTEETDSEFIHTMTEARLTMNWTGGCDTIQIFNTLYSIQKTDAMIFKVEYFIREFYTERDGSGYLLCEQ